LVSSSYPSIFGTLSIPGPRKRSLSNSTVFISTHCATP
jgi:hypothetical protein